MVDATVDLLPKLIRKLAVCEEEDRTERRAFIARHAAQAGTTVAATLAQLQEAGCLSQEQVETWDNDGDTVTPVLVLLSVQDATPPAELRPTARSASVSAAHEVPPGATALRPLLEARGWRRLAAILDGGNSEAAPWRGVWYAEHARAQLAPGSLCCSEPAWVAWTCWRPQVAGGGGSGGDGGDGGSVGEALANSGSSVAAVTALEEGGEGALSSWVVHVCAVDEGAARRALLALEVARGEAAAVEVAAWPRARPQAAEVGTVPQVAPPWLALVAP